MEQEAIKFIAERVPFVQGRSQRFSLKELAKLLVDFKLQGITPDKIKALQQEIYGAGYADGYADGLGDGTIKIER